PRTTNGDGTSTSTIPGPVTTEEKAQKKNNVNARSMLLMALPNEHLLTFSQYKDVKTLFEVIQARFGGDDATKKTQRTFLKQIQLAILGENISQKDLNTKFLRSLPSEWNTHVVVWRNKADLNTMSIDDLYNNFKIIEQEVQRTLTTSSSSGSQNMTFLSSPGSTKEVNTATIQVSTVSTPVSTVSSHDNTANLSDATVYAFLANQPNGSQLVHKDLEQIHEDDLEEMDLKWQLALLSMRAKWYFQRTDGTFLRECRSPRNQESRPRNHDSSRKTMNVEDTSSKAMVAIDRACFDLSYMADDEAPTNMALIAFSDSEEFQHPEFKGYGPKDSKSVCVDTSNEIKKALDALIIEDLVFYSDDDESEVMVLKSDNVQHIPEQANQPRKVSQNHRNNSTNWNEMRTQKLGVRNFAPTAVLTKSGIVPISTARQSSSRAVVLVSAAMPINTAAPKPLVNVVKPRQNAFQNSHSLSRRPFDQQTTLINRILNNKINTAKVNSVNTAKGNKVTSAVGKQGINDVKMIEELDKDEDVNLVSEQGEVHETTELSNDNDDTTLAETLLNIKRSTSKDKEKGITQETELPKKIKKREMIQLSLDEEQEQEKYNVEKALELQRKLDKREEDEGYKHSYFKGMKYEEIKPIFERVWDQVHTFVPKDFEIKKEVIKRSGFHLQQESSNKQKLDQQTKEEKEEVEAQVDSDQEVEEMKLYTRIVPDEEIAIDAIPLATKPPVIIKYKIVKEGRISTYHIIRADGSTKRYTSMINLLENIDREDLEALWKLVKDKHGNTRPEEGYERFL
nr:ribonuclease H-like domain-containing protein [Tanacetum cinerariifolium]